MRGMEISCLIGKGMDVKGRGGDGTAQMNGEGEKERRTRIQG
jgi:hypothetical protein